MTADGARRAKGKGGRFAPTEGQGTRWYRQSVGKTGWPATSCSLREQTVRGNQERGG